MDHASRHAGAPASTPPRRWSSLTAFAALILLLTLAAEVAAQRRDGRNDEPRGTYLGTLSANRWFPDSVARLLDRLDRHWTRDRAADSTGRRNRWFGSSARIYSRDGRYLGKLSANPYDPDSIANPYGRYGSRYSPDSVNNPYSRYGSRYSNESPRNPYATRPPRIYRGRAR